MPSERVAFAFFVMKIIFYSYVLAYLHLSEFSFGFSFESILCLILLTVVTAIFLKSSIRDVRIIINSRSQRVRSA